MRRWGAGLVAAVLASGPAHAVVVDSSPVGFEVQETAEIAAPAAKVWAALGQIGAWWDSQHSWSHDARNLSLELKLGGCLCEKLDGGAGGAGHMIVIFADPDRTAILSGTLGPLIYSGAAGHLIWSLAEKDGKTTLTQSYYVGGYFKGGLDQLAGPVDGVLGEQMNRLKSYVETGKPTP